MKLSGILVCGVLAALPAFASDHIDGPVTTSHRVADLTDLYAFPTPRRPGFLTVILDAYPLVASTGHFTDKVNYSVIVRRASLGEAGGSPSFRTGDEVDIDCTFRTPEATRDHVVTCRSSNGPIASRRYGVVQDKGGGDKFRLYAGMRADPFFFNAEFARDAIAGTLDAPKESDTMSGANILTIVMEVELRALYPNAPPSMIAVAAETTTRDAPGGPLRRLDRVGRPEITNVTMAARGQPDLRDRYNADRPFQVPPGNRRLYEERIARNVAFYDALDGRRDWKDRDRDALASLLADDFLVVDAGKPCLRQSFFEIENAILRHRIHATCGGRRPDDDIMDTLFTLYVGGPDGKPVRDGVDRPSRPVSPGFPYLAEPDLSFWSRIKVWIAKKYLRISDAR